MLKPFVYIASPYTQGDPAVNTRFQCYIFDKLLGDGLVTPIAPLWSHFQHVAFPRPYGDWLVYDLELIQRCDMCLRLDAYDDNIGYYQAVSAGADMEEAEFIRLQRPVFRSIADLYDHLRSLSTV